MTVLRQLFTVSAIGLGTLAQRRGTSFVIVAGVACVVGVLVSMLSVTVGLTRMYLAGGGEAQLPFMRFCHCPLAGGLQSPF